jgi:peroxiredoxin
MKGGGQKGDSQKDWLSSTSKMRFTINPKVSDDIFVFKPPKGTMEVSEEDLFSSDFFKSLEGKRRSDFTLDSGSLEGKRLSDFTFTLNSLKGEKISLSSFKGKIVIIYFEKTFPYAYLSKVDSDYLSKVLGILQKLHNEYKDKGVIIIWVTRKEKEEVNKLISQNKCDFTILLDTNGEISYTDRIFLVNKEGTIVRDRIEIEDIVKEVKGGTVVFVEDNLRKLLEDFLREEIKEDVKGSLKERIEKEK